MTDQVLPSSDMTINFAHRHMDLERRLDALELIDQAHGANILDLDARVKALERHLASHAQGATIECGKCDSAQMTPTDCQECKTGKPATTVEDIAKAMSAALSACPCDREHRPDMALQAVWLHKAAGICARVALRLKQEGRL